MNVINNRQDETYKIRTILNDHKTTTAFLIGNGIHYQYRDCNIPWKQLLKDLWVEYTGDQCEIPKGISFTEFYDIIELIALKPNIISLTDSLKEIAKGIKNTPKDMSIVKRVLNLVVKSSSAKLDINALVNNEQFKNVNREFAANCRDFCERNYENTSALSDLDCMLITMELCTNGAKQQVLKNLIKKDIAGKFPDKQKYNLRNLIEKIKEFKAPILTTNFDIYMHSCPVKFRTSY